MVNLSVRLRELRGATSQAEMARSIGIPQQAWARYEKGIVAPNAETLFQICRVHACSSDWLLGLKEDGTAAVNVANSPGAAVASGRNARASVGPNCEQCPFKLLAMEFKDRAAKLPRKK